MYRESSTLELDALRSDDVKLQQHSVFGPWIVLGLCAMSAVMLIYLIYANVLFPPAPPTSLEHSLRIMDVPPSARSTQRTPPSLVTSEPAPASKKAQAQNRTPYALLGGQGPAAPPQYTRETGTP
jgi:hypothetical protein